MKKIRISQKVALDGLDGGGTWLSQPIVNYILGVRGAVPESIFRALGVIQKKIGSGTSLERSLLTLQRAAQNRFQNQQAPYNKTYGKAFEWCSGPGFIGFSLLEQGICDKLCLADINPEAITSVEHTIRENGLEDRVSYYVSDNLKDIPAEEKFDLVVSNPPNYFRLNPEHFLYDTFKEDLRPNDPEWRIHWDFYKNIKRHLNPGAVLLISEVEPFNTEVYIPKHERVPYDIRPRPPIEDFKEMIEAGGLTYVDIEKYFVGGGVELWMLVSTNA